MTPFDYLVPLVAILVGLAVADLASSLHRLLRNRHRVRWHWFPLAGAVLLILLTLEIWWGLRDVGRVELPLTIGSFLPFVVELILLYLIASAALPDEIPAQGVDLRAHYFETRSYFWTLLAILMAVFVLHRIGLIWAVHGAGSLPGVLWSVLPNLGVIAIALSLGFVMAPWWQALWLAALPILYLLNLIGRPLT